MYRIYCSVAAILAFTAVASGQTVLTINLQNSQTVETGFAVVRSVVGFGDGLMLFEKLTNRAEDVDSQSTIWPGPFVTSTALVVSFDDASNQNTGIAIVNPSNFSVVLTFTLRNQQGGIVATASRNLGAFQQLSRFVHQLFTSQSNVGVTGLLSVDSTGPIAVAGLLFRGSGFSSLPTTVTGSAIPPDNLLVPQFAVGGGWSTEVVIANRLGSSQVVAVDFRSPTGQVIATAPNVNLLPRSVATVSLVPRNAR